jgi:hypothetical protein
MKEDLVSLAMKESRVSLTKKRNGPRAMMVIRQGRE